MSRIALALGAFVAFTVYSLSVVANHGPLGFLAVPLQGGWSLQVFMDLAVATVCFWVVAVPDARSRGITAWPYVVLTPFLGSIVLLAYFVHRSLRERAR